MVEVFSTNVQEAAEASRLSAMLQRRFPGVQVSFDLEDCDKILRMEGRGISPDEVMMLFSRHGFSCMVLE